jgi:hypothetical protein
MKPKRQDSMRTKVGGLFQDSYPTKGILQATTARWDFTAARNDAITLLTIHDQETGGKSGRPEPRLEALKRSALILAVTAWESFVEDTLRKELDKLLKTTADPFTISSIFNGIAHQWLESARRGDKKPPDLMQWTGDKWKDAVRQSLSKSLESFNTPNSKNTARLFERYLGVDITKKWTWQRVSSVTAQKQLDALIKLRGRVVHRGKTLLTSLPQAKDVRRRDVVKALNLVFNLVDATEHALGIAPTAKSLDESSTETKPI